MTTARSSVKRFFRGLWQRLPLTLVKWLAGVWAYVLSGFDKATLNQRRSVAVIGSLLLHLGLFLLLLPTATGLTSLGTTGIGSVDGAGTTVTLVDASEPMPPNASETQSSATSESAVSEPATTDDATQPTDQVAKTDEVTLENEDHSQIKTEKVQSDNLAPLGSTAQAAAGAHGQKGQANTDLWNAISPCWNRVAGKNTLSATLIISFSDDGGLSVPPVIERDPNAPITDQSLQSEALALQALAECGAYPMAKGEQNVQVVFPSPTAMLSAK